MAHVGECPAPDLSLMSVGVGFLLMYQTEGCPAEVTAEFPEEASSERMSAWLSAVLNSAKPRIMPLGVSWFELPPLPAVHGEQPNKNTGVVGVARLASDMSCTMDIEGCPIRSGQ